MENTRIKSTFFSIVKTTAAVIVFGALVACNQKAELKEEQISVVSEDSMGVELSTGSDTTLNSIEGNVALNQLSTSPNTVVLTGLPEHRLVTVYKTKKETKSSGGDVVLYPSSSYSSYEADESDRVEHFMPGIDILYGYNLMNVAHYDLTSQKLNFLFNRAALIKTLYYPAFVQDSIDKKPITRNYYLVSVYDEDTNKDTLINKRDLRRFYHFDASGSVKTRLVPADYSVVRSQYDSQNDIMYLFAKQDADKNGIVDKKEPLHIFWISLKAPGLAKRLY